LTSPKLIEVSDAVTMAVTMGGEERKRKLAALLDPDSDDEGTKHPVLAMVEQDMLRQAVEAAKAKAKEHGVDARIAAEHMGNAIANFVVDPDAYPLSEQVLKWRMREALLLAGRTSKYLICNQTLTVFTSVKLTSPGLNDWNGPVQSALRIGWPHEFLSDASQRLQTQAIIAIIGAADQPERASLVEFLCEAAGWSCSATTRRQAPALHKAVTEESLSVEEKMQIIHCLIEAGADPDQEYKEYTARELFDEHVAPLREDKNTLAQILLAGVE
jgi:hypothetical protein